MDTIILTAGHKETLIQPKNCPIVIFFQLITPLYDKVHSIQQHNIAIGIKRKYKIQNII